MSPVTNPFNPGAGTPPPELAGRDAIREAINVAVLRLSLGKPEKSVILLGLRGVGKTVLLDRIREDVEDKGNLAIRMEAPESKSLPALLAPQLRKALLQLSRIEKTKNAATRALKVFAAFVKAFKVTYKDIEVALDFEPLPGLADNGDLENDLAELFEIIGEATKSAGKVLVLFIDELQYVKEDELAALITALHRISQKKLPIMLVGAGLPQLRGALGNAKSYSERLFEFPLIGPLNNQDAKSAIENPLKALDVDIHSDALELIIKETQGYPYFLQEWGKETWAAASSSPITKKDVKAATAIALASLDGSFFRVRFDRLTPSEKRYLRAMAELGAGPHRSGDIAEVLDKQVNSLAPTRSQLITKGMIWSPNHGDTAFTVPLFDEFMRRIMPRDWKTLS